MNRLAGKIALVTGAARGIGAAIARRFHEEGATVAINDVDAAAADAAARPLGGIGLGADVADSGAVAAMFAELAGRYGHLDVLVNNAGISGLEGAGDAGRLIGEAMVAQLEERARTGRAETPIDVTANLPDEAWRRMLAVHLDGTFYCTREALRLMLPRGAGAIVNMGSIMGTSGGEGAPHYCAAKAGILGLTRAVAREVASRGVRVNAVAPGFIATDMTTPFRAGWRAVEAQTPLGRLGDVDDIAWAAVYLASDEAKFVTGQVLSPNGGWHMSQ